MLLLLFIGPIWLWAQNQTPSGYLILHTQDTLYGKVSPIKESGFGGRRFYKKIKITTTQGKRKQYPRQKVVAFEIDGVFYESFYLRQATSSVLNFSLDNPNYIVDPVRGEQHFLKCIHRGALSHYKLEWLEQGNSTLWSMSLLKKAGEPTFIRADQGLFGLKRKALLTYFSDCSKIQTALQERQLKQVAQVVDFYNTHCGV